MNQNTVHLLRIYIPAILLTVAIISAAIYKAVQGEPIALISVLFVLGVSVIAFVWARYKRLALFRELKPDAAIKFYHQKLKRAANGNALAAYLSAYVATLYGEYDRAREELCAIRWSSLPPMYQGYETFIHALLSLFQMRNAANALDLATEAKELCTIDPHLPGARTRSEAFDAFILACRALLGESNPDVLSKLDRAIEKLPGVAPAIPAWALATRLRASGKADEAVKYEKVINRLTPNCKPLHQFNYPSFT